MLYCIVLYCIVLYCIVLYCQHLKHNGDILLEILAFCLFGLFEKKNLKVLLWFSGIQVSRVNGAGRGGISTGFT